MKRNWVLFILCVLLVAVILVLYWPITKTFYQQDEWLGYGLYLANGTRIILQNTGGLWGIVFGQGRILTNLLYFLFYKYFPLNVFQISIFAILLHVANVLIVFYLARKLFKKTLPAFLGCLFFAFSSVSSSAVIWPAASINTLPSTTLILISLIFYFRYLESLKIKWLVVGFLSIYLSLFFKETGIFLFLLLPISALIFKKYSFVGFIKTYWYFFMSVIVIVVFRLLQFMYIPHTEALFLTGSSKYFFDSLVIRSILYPLTSFSLTFVPSEPFVWFARYIESVYYPFFIPQEFIVIAQTVILDFLASILSFVIFILIFVFARRSTNAEKKTIIFFVIFMLSGFLPYIIIAKNYAYLESRYFYLANLAAAILLGWLAKRLFERFKNILIKIFFLSLFVCFLGIHLRYLKNEISGQVLVSQERISFLTQLSQQVPSLSKNKNIFYVISDRDYYINGNKVPFQQGFGYTLMTIYFKSGKIPKEFLDEQYLFEIGGQGYKEANGYGFGYFSDITKLKEYSKQKDISIIGLYYDTKEEKIKQLDASLLMH